MADSSKRRVSYYYEGDIGHYYYGPGHPMKPHRLKLAHHLVLGYDLYRKMECFRPHTATVSELTQFHSPDYINFLRTVTPETEKRFSTQLQRFNVGKYTDCPVFDGLFEFCQLYTGASIDAAVRLNHGLTDVAINWGGGLHHAKKSEASGFCYVNDIVLAILELLKFHARVLYIDIDIHHGDGVEEAFYTTDRVMTVSFHKFGDFFPGTGDVSDIGAKDGKCCSVNFPLKQGIDDKSYLSVFKPIIEKVMEVFKPGAIVLQCGADSLTGDRLGCFNLTLKGHAECVKFVRSFNIPVLVLGGGGYTIRNVARCWAYETAVLLGEDIKNSIPGPEQQNPYYEFFSPKYQLHLTANSKMDNKNSRDYLAKCRNEILDNLRAMAGAPGVQMQHLPPDWILKEAEEDEDAVDPDKRAETTGKTVEHPSELATDAGDDGEGQPNGNAREKKEAGGDKSKGKGKGDDAMDVDDEASKEESQAGTGTEEKEREDDSSKRRGASSEDDVAAEKPGAAAAASSSSTAATGDGEGAAEAMDVVDGDEAVAEASSRKEDSGTIKKKKNDDEEEEDGVAAMDVEDSSSSKAARKG